MADHRQVVGDEDVGDLQLLLQLVEQVEHLRLHRQVERGDRLVADDDVGVQCQRAGDADALALAAGELLRVLVGGLGAEADEVEQAPHPHVAVLAGLVHALVAAPRLGDDVARRHPRVQRRVGVLEHHLHAAAELQQVLAAQAERVDAVEAHGALVGALQHHQCPCQRGLSAAGLADQAERLAAREVEGDAVERAQPLLAGVRHAERLAEVADLEQVAQTSSFDQTLASPLLGSGRRPCGRPPTASSVGRLVAQMSWASGQRAW